MHRSHYMIEHQQMLQRCIQLAESALGTTYPNPIVGCVIVHHHKIIGDGFTSPAGQNHAEINAIQSVKDKSLLKESTLYVSLEPCAHYGKTPPCSLAIIKHQIPKVVIGCVDTHSKVAGKGIQMLKDAGIEVVLGIEEEKCKEVNRGFFTVQNQNRPYIILKWAQTANGFIGSKNEEQLWISNQYSKQLVHKWRAEEHAILVGTNTALIDNPSLTARLWQAKNQPIRVLIDKELKVSESSNIFNSDAKTIIFNAQKNQTEENIERIQIDFSEEIIPQILEHLAQKEIQSLIVEGGAKTIQNFIDLDLWDEARIIQSELKWNDGLKAPKLDGFQIEKKRVQNDEITILRNKKK